MKTSKGTVAKYKLITEYEALCPKCLLLQPTCANTLVLPGLTQTPYLTGIHL